MATVNFMTTWSNRPRHLYLALGQGAAMLDVSLPSIMGATTGTQEHRSGSVLRCHKLVDKLVCRHHREHGAPFRYTPSDRVQENDVTGGCPSLEGA